MTPKLLFIDTEFSEKSKFDTKKPSDSVLSEGIIHTAWCIYDPSGKMLKKENLFYKLSDIKYDLSATLKDNNYNEIVGLLFKDILKYKPVIIGNLSDLDNQILTTVLNYAKNQKLVSKIPYLYAKNKGLYAYNKLLKSLSYDNLDNLYLSLFNKKLVYRHDAYEDAEAMAQCYFKLIDQKKLRHRDIIPHYYLSLLTEQLNKLKSKFKA